MRSGCSTRPTTSRPTRDAPKHPFWDQDGVHEIYEEWRKVLDGYDRPTRILCGEAWVQPVERLMRYVRPTEMHQSFNFEFLDCRWDAKYLVATITSSLAASASVGAPTTWVLSNHDVVRHASRLGLPQDLPRPNGIRAEDPQPDAALGLRRARAATTLMLGLPGAAYLYQGEELGLPDATDLPDEVRQDPAFVRTGGEHTGRDGCRIPFPWSASGPSLGFGPTAATWLPQPAAYRELAVDRQEGVPGSTLELYRHLLGLRREHAVGTGSLEWLDAYVDDARRGRLPVHPRRPRRHHRARQPRDGSGGASRRRSRAGGLRGAAGGRRRADRHGGLVHRLTPVDNGTAGPDAVSSVGTCLGMRFGPTTSGTPLR